MWCVQDFKAEMAAAEEEERAEMLRAEAAEAALAVARQELDQVRFCTRASHGSGVVSTAIQMQSVMCIKPIIAAYGGQNTCRRRMPCSCRSPAPASHDAPKSGLRSGPHFKPPDLGKQGLVKTVLSAVCARRSVLPCDLGARKGRGAGRAGGALLARLQRLPDPAPGARGRARRPAQEGM